MIKNCFILIGFGDQKSKATTSKRKQLI